MTRTSTSGFTRGLGDGLLSFSKRQQSNQGKGFHYPSFRLPVAEHDLAHVEPSGTFMIVHVPSKCWHLQGLQLTTRLCRLALKRVCEPLP